MTLPVTNLGPGKLYINGELIGRVTDFKMGYEFEDENDPKSRRVAIDVIKPVESEDDPTE